MKGESLAAGPYDGSDGFAEDAEEAERRYNAYKDQDPFSDRVEPALLNSGDIADYVAATGMIFPFRPQGKLKPASYEVNLRGRCVSFTGDTRADMEVRDIEPGDKYPLRPNSIAFVGLEPMFRIPQYIALRFNLRIDHVYKGLLVGTGPLVDPGFKGRLWLPLHNLTTNEYVLEGGEGLVWMEFTKLSRLYSEEERGTRQRYFTRFPDDKIEREIEDYLYQAEPLRAIGSSIPSVFRETKEAATAARTDAQEANDAADMAKASAKRSEGATERTRQFIQGALVITVILGVLSALGVIATLWTLWSGTNDRIDSLVNSQVGQDPSVDADSESLKKTVADLRERVTTLESWLTLLIVLVIVAAFLSAVGAFALARFHNDRARANEDPGTTS